MNKRQVTLLACKQLLGESLEHVLRGMEDVEVLGPWALDDQVLQRLASSNPDIILLAICDDLPEHGMQYIGPILEHFPETPLIQVHLEHNVVRFYSSQTLPAQRQALLDLIRSLPAEKNKAD